MRAHRPKHSDLSLEQQAKAISRAIANVYQRRGKLVPQPCSWPGCWIGPDKTQKHHPDHSKPLEVVWLCPFHHHKLHRMAA
jgi:hypothetical protein